MIKSIPLNKLAQSPRNVRRHTDPAADAELKASIAARGLLQNLIVRPAAKGKFEVEAGERRRRALLALADEKILARDHDVTCLVLEDNRIVAIQGVAGAGKSTVLKPVADILREEGMGEHAIGTIPPACGLLRLTTDFVEILDSSAGLIGAGIFAMEECDLDQAFGNAQRNCVYPVQGRSISSQPQPLLGDAPRGARDFHGNCADASAAEHRPRRQADKSWRCPTRREAGHFWRCTPATN